MITSSKAVFIATLIASLYQKSSQRTVQFGNIKYDEVCGLTSNGSWSADGLVTLTSQDFLVFDPKVVIQSVRELCTVDLTTCPPPNLQRSKDVCYCQEQSGDIYKIRVTSTASIGQNGETVKAIVPAHEPFKSLQGVGVIGRLPEIRPNRQRVKAVYQIDDGDHNELNSVQNITVCPGRRFRIDICVENATVDSLLTIEVDTLRASRVGKCIGIQHWFDSDVLMSHTLKFDYNEHAGCTNADTFVINLKESGVVCGQPSTTSTAGSVETSALTTSSSTTVTKSTFGMGEITASSVTITEKPTKATPSVTVLSSTSTPGIAVTDKPTTATPTVTITEKPTKATPAVTVLSTTSTPGIAVTDKPTTATSTVTILPATSIPGICPDTPRRVVTLPGGEIVLKDDVTDGWDWLIIQRRVSNETSFQRNWTEYVQGFGNVSDSFWLGLEPLHKVCNNKTPCELRVDLKYESTPNDGQINKNPKGCYFASYMPFWISGASDNFRLEVENYLGNAGDMLSYQNGSSFATPDRDNSQQSCAKAYASGWWFNTGPRHCHRSSLNGLRGADLHIRWNSLGGYKSLQFSEMKVRHIS